MKNTLRSFVSGELDPSLHQRVDLARYTTGLDTCRNFIVRAQGGVHNRPGMRFIGEVKDSTRKTRVIPFEFNTEQTYILEFGHQVMRVIRDGGYVLDGVGPAIFEIATPYSEDDIFDINFVQSADTMTLAHRNYATRDLTRTDHDAWTLTEISFASSGTIPTWSTAVSADISGVTNAVNGVVTTTTDHGFSTGDTVSISLVNGMTELNGNFYKITVLTTTTFELNEDTTTFGVYTAGGVAEVNAAIQTTGSGEGDFNKSYRYVITATDEDGVESLQSSEQFLRTKSLTQTAGIRLAWDSVISAKFYTVYKDVANGTGTYGFIGETKNPIFEDYNIGPDTSRTPPEENVPISSVNNYVGAVGYYQQRRLFANTDNNPQTFFATQSGIFNSLRFSTPTRDDDGITFTINSRQVNEIRHIISLEDLVLLTSGNAYRITEGQDFVLTPSTIGAKPQAYTGASKVRPAIINDSILFASEKSGKIFDLNYAIESARYSGNDVSIMAEHLFEGRSIVDMDYSKDPFGVLWCVMDDGALIGLTYQKEHKVWAWHRHDTDGQYESVASIAEDGRDATYFVVKRTINGSDVRYIERLEKRYNDVSENSFYVDSGLSYNGSPVTVLTGLDHLEGETVITLADGNVVRDLTVSSGSITLPRAASIVHVGLQYLSDIVTLGIDSAEQSTQGRKKSIAEVAIRFQKSRGGWVGPDTDNLIEIKPRFDSDSYNTIALKTNERRITISPDWNDDGKVAIRQLDPLPMSILTITPEFDIGG